MQILKFKDIKHKFPKQSWIYNRNEKNNGEFEDVNILYIEDDYQTDNFDLDAPFVSFKERIKDYQTYLQQEACFCILIDGSLTAKNIFNENTDGATGLIVLGNCIVDNMIVGGQEIHITGNLTVNECFWGDYNHGELTVNGNTNAFVFAATAEYHYDYKKERITANYFLLDDDEEEPFEWDKVSNLFLPEMLTEQPDEEDDINSWDEWLFRDNMILALQEGKPVLKNKSEILTAKQSEAIIPSLFAYNAINNLEQLEKEADNFIKLFIEVVNLCSEQVQEYESNGWTIKFDKKDEKEPVITAVNKDYFAFAICLEKHEKKTLFTKKIATKLSVGFYDTEEKSGAIFGVKSNDTYNKMFVSLWHSILKDAEKGTHFYKQFRQIIDVTKAHTWFSLPIVTEPEAAKIFYGYETSEEWRGFWRGSYMFYFRPENEEKQKPAILQIARNILSEDDFDKRSYRFWFDKKEHSISVLLKYNSSQEGKYDDRYQSIDGATVFPFDWEKYKEAIDWYGKAEQLIESANQTYLNNKSDEGDDIENDADENGDATALKSHSFTKPYETVTVDGINFKVIDIHEAHKLIGALTDFEGDQLYDVYDNNAMFPLDEENPFFLLAEEDVAAEQFSLVFSTDECPDIFVLGFIFLKNLITTKYIEGHDIDVSPVMIVLGNVQTKNLMVLGNWHYIGNGLECETIYGFYNHGSLFVKGETEATLIYTDDMHLHFEKFKGVAVAVSSGHGLRIFTTTHLPQDDGTFSSKEYYVMNTHKLSSLVADQYIERTNDGEEKISYDGDAYEAMLQGESIIDWNNVNQIRYDGFQTYFETRLQAILTHPTFIEKGYVEWKNENGWEHYFVSNFIHDGIKYIQVVRNFAWGNTVTTRIVFGEGTKDYQVELIHYNEDNTVNLFWTQDITVNSMETRAVKAAMLELFDIFLGKDEEQNLEAGTNANTQPDLSFYEMAVDSIAIPKDFKLELKILLKAAFENSKSFYDEEDEFILSDRGLTYDEHGHLTAKFVFVDKMIAASQMEEVDWKEDETEVRFCVNKILQGKNYGLQLSAEAKYGTDTFEIIQSINDNELMPLGYVLELLDIDSDSYVFTVIPLSKQKEVAKIFERMK